MSHRDGSLNFFVLPQLASHSPTARPVGVLAGATGLPSPTVIRQSVQARRGVTRDRGTASEARPGFSLFIQSSS